MWRRVHRWPAVTLGLLLIFLSITGSILAVDPVLKRFDRHVQPLGEATVGDVLRRSAKANPHFVIDRIRVDYTGRVMLRGSDAAGSRDVPINLKNGRLGRVPRESAFMVLVQELHRNLALGPDGRPITLIAVLSMLVLMLSGLTLVARRLGGWSRLLSSEPGRGLNKWHSVLGRLMILPLLVTVISGCWMSLVTNGGFPSGIDDQPQLPETTIKADPVAAGELAVFDQFSLADLTELNFPIEADWWDVYSLRQGGTYYFIDRVSGEVLDTAPAPFWARALDLFTMLHTGQGASVWGAIAGLVSLSVPFFTVTGVINWLRRRHPRPSGMVRAGAAEVVILVGSETGTTWGFAVHLASRLRDLGKKVHLGGMNTTFAMREEAILLVLAATYGDGKPPSGANQFLSRLAAYSGARRFAVLGFGDKAFPAYCAFADDCHAALEQTAREALLPMTDVNRRSSQAFAAWGRALGSELDLPELVLDYAPPRPRTRGLVLIEREDFDGAGAPAAILRFRADQGRLPRFHAGDLLAVLPPADPVARLYSLASCKRDGIVELCVGKVDGGICSTHLLGLEPGDAIDAYVERNPDFRPAPKEATIMICAGTGIAPFAGMIRQNRGRTIDLFFGIRHPEKDYYYRSAIDEWVGDGRLSGYFPAFSRHERRTYVQDQLRDASSLVEERLRAGARVMVCGSSRMAHAVAQEIDAIAAMLNTSVAELRQHGRYLEDVY
jgi:sulfite reductase (NADPH) flavoprotein alpha-component